MDISKAENILKLVQDKSMSIGEAMEFFRQSPTHSLGFAELDIHRGMRQGFPEVVFGEGKTADQVVSITRALLDKNQKILVTRLDQESAEAAMQAVPGAEYHKEAKCLTYGMSESSEYPGYIGIITAGTSDIPVASEAAVTARMMGHRIEMHHDLGVAGIHRILSRQEWIQKAHVLIVVAGMEGALPSVVAGLTDSPVIAVPTSVGYGTNFGGITALLGMLNSCGSGVTVVNVDNGFGAGFAASQIHKLTKINPQ